MRFSHPAAANLQKSGSQVTPARREQFDFEDLAGIYSEPGLTRLFAVCTRYAPIDGLKVLPAGTYLCANCTEGTRRQTLDTLMQQARTVYYADPEFTVQLVVVSGILQWNYEGQVYLGPGAPRP